MLILAAKVDVIENPIGLLTLKDSLFNEIGEDYTNYSKITIYPRSATKECSVYENETLHTIMDKVCELCHDFYSHQQPSMRSECRFNCFQTETFKKCLRIFKPSKRLRL
uniref:Uncharacterized protein n=1 Tax=Ditylenchus dipsaci TaxID=166011 RepID=A0A915DRQ9_9BILA